MIWIYSHGTHNRHAPQRVCGVPGRNERSFAMATQGAFKHTSKYAATATKYGTREGEDGDGGPSSKKEPGVWDGFKADERAPRSRKNARLGDREKLLDKDYMAEMRRQREQSNSIMTQVRAREARGTASEPSIASDTKETRTRDDRVR
jgi:hypothetical protein